jgi:peptidoglycan-N-acetylglucosamine deacetylase
MAATSRQRTRLSRRQFLLGAAAVAAEATFVAGCAGHGPRVLSLPPTTTTSGPVPPTTSPPIAAKHALEAIVPRIPSFIRSGPATRPTIALTIDDLFGNQGVDNLSRLLDIGNAKSVRFTVFPTGGALQGHLSSGQQDVWQRAVTEGHEIGNHTFTHRNLQRASDQDIRNEMVSTQQVLDRVLGPALHYPMRLMRPPGGSGGFVAGGDPRIMAVLGQLGLSMVMWTIDSNGTAGGASFAARIMSTATNGSIVLFHFTTFGADGFASLIDRLRTERRLEPTTVSGLFG